MVVKWWPLTFPRSRQLLRCGWVNSSAFQIVQSLIHSSWIIWLFACFHYVVLVVSVYCWWTLICVIFLVWYITGLCIPVYVCTGTCSWVLDACYRLSVLKSSWKVRIFRANLVRCWRSKVVALTFLLVSKPAPALSSAHHHQSLPWRWAVSGECKFVSFLSLWRFFFEVLCFLGLSGGAPFVDSNVLVVRYH